MIEFLIKYKFVILFYILIALIFYKNRQEVTTQGKIIFLLKTKLGLNLMDRLAEKHRELIKLIGYIGLGTSYVGLFWISFELIRSTIAMFGSNSAPGLTLALPGANIPGVGILPFWHWLLAIFIIATIHEFSHGVVARAHKLKVKSSGVVLFGPIIGAFVEPDENQIHKASDVAQYSVFAAGPFSNIVLGLVTLLLFGLLSTFIMTNYVVTDGVAFGGVEESLPSYFAGLRSDMIITGVDGVAVNTYTDFSTQLFCKKPGDEVTLQTNATAVKFTLSEHPSDNSRPYVGITNVRTSYHIKEGVNDLYYRFLLWVQEFLKWLWLLSLGIGLFNLLPIPLLDGGQIVQLSLRKVKGKEKGDKWFGFIGIFFILVILAGLFLPYIVPLF